MENQKNIGKRRLDPISEHIRGNKKDRLQRENDDGFPISMIRLLKNVHFYEYAKIDQ